MKKFLIVFGIIDFHDDIATVYDVYDCIMVDNPDDIDKAGEEHCEKNGYDFYVAPQQYAGEVIFWK